VTKVIRVKKGIHPYIILKKVSTEENEVQAKLHSNFSITYNKLAFFSLKKRDLLATIIEEYLKRNQFNHILI
jgi:hypothetical protein